MDNNELKKEVEVLKKQVQFLTDMLYKNNFSDNVVFEKKVVLRKSIEIGNADGILIGTQTTQKIGFFGETPVAQQSAITAPSGGATIDAEARTAINSIRTVLSTFGFTA